MENFIVVKNCFDCNGELFGRKETIDGVTYYGLYCKNCEKWFLKDDKVLDNLFAYLDKEVYKIILLKTNAGDEEQINHLAEILNISPKDAQQYFQKTDDVIIFEGSAEEVLRFGRIDYECIWYRIEPLFPYKVGRGFTKKNFKKFMEDVKAGKYPQNDLRKKEE